MTSMLMMAMTAMSSMRVKPLVLVDLLRVRGKSMPKKIALEMRRNGVFKGTPGASGWTWEG